MVLPAGPALFAAQTKQKSQTSPRQPANSPRGIQSPANQSAKNAANQQSAPAVVPAKPIDLRYVQPDAFAVAVLHPKAFFDAPTMEFFPREVVTAAVMQEVGIDPTKIERLVISVANFAPPQEPTTAVAAYLSGRADPSQALAKLKARAQKQSAGGTEYWIVQPQDFAFYMPDDQTIVAAPESVLKQMIAGRAVADTPMTRLLKQADLSAHIVVLASLDAVRNQLQALMQQAPRVPPPFQPFLRIPELTSAVETRIKVGGSPDLQWIFHATSEQAAVQLEQLINQAIAMGKQMVMAQLQQQVQGDDPVQQASARYVQRLINHIAGRIEPKRAGQDVTIALDTGGGWASSGVMVALLLPAVQAAREAARRTQSMNNMKQISLALHNYHDVYKGFPPQAISDKQGKPLLSWRVAVLPYLEENDLYKQFHLDEPWDSEHNKKLLGQMPAVYANTNLADRTRTNYLVPVGDDTIFKGDTSTKLADVKDGVSKTIMLLEADADRAVPWTKPDDYQIDPDSVSAGLGGLRAGGFLAAFADGSVRFVASGIDAEVLKRLFKKSDGQPVDIQ
jgi:hypothetical protein